LTRYTFDPRPLWKPRKSQRDMQISIVDETLDLVPRRAAKIIGPVQHAHAVRAAARAYCDVANALEGMPPSDSHATVVVCGHNPHREARVIVRGRVVARCDAFNDGLNEAWAGLIAASLNDCINALPGSTG